MEPKAARKLPHVALAGLVADWKVGARIFSFPRFFGHATGPFGAIAAGGASIPARMLQSPVERKPDLDAGVLVRAVPGKSNTGGSTDVR